MKISILLGLIVLFLLSSCGPRPPVGQLDAEDQYLLAMEKFEDGKYDEAKLEFQKLIWNYPGSDYVDDAQYHLAECSRQLEDYPTAIIEYGRLLRNYSQSPLAPAAQYDLALSYYEQSLPSPLDQDFTQKAIMEIQLFLEEYPNSEFVPRAEELLLTAQTKLAKKEYENARLYYKMGDFDSAIIYINELLEKYAHTRWTGDAQYLLGECYRRQGEWEQALTAYRQILEMDVSPKLKRQTQKRIHQIEEKMK